MTIVCFKQVDYIENAKENCFTILQQDILLIILMTTC